MELFENNAPRDDPEYSITPRRIQCKRVKGWRMPANTIYVGRPAKWGNPLPISSFYNNDRRIAVDFYKAYMHNLKPFRQEELIAELKGKNLACWCPLDQPCHADVLLEIANK